MPGRQTEFNYLIASGAPAVLATDLSSLAPAVQAEVALDELVLAARLHLAQSSLLGFRPGQGTLVDLYAAMQTWPNDLDVAFPWDFSDPAAQRIPGWEPALDGPARPTNVVIGLEAANTLYINLGCAAVTTLRSGAAIASPAAIEVWQVVDGDLIRRMSGAASGIQIGPFPAGQPVTLMLIARDADGRPSYPTAFVSATPHT